jgi:hypothetical protein
MRGRMAGMEECTECPECGATLIIMSPSVYGGWIRACPDCGYDTGASAPLYAASEDAGEANKRQQIKDEKTS